MPCFRSISAWMALLGLCVAGLATTPATAAEEAAVAAEQKMEAKPRSEPRGRLPNFYGQVVSEKQKEEIYEIQSSYQAKLDELIRQIVAIKAERDAKINQTLTPEQLKEVASLRAESEKRQTERRAAATKSENAK
ncbi:low affinity iron permease family protein [Blastopirellula sp. JC732]|uniref:Low affinity iron permease family protein n=1 Tax=Blastopirellula sediminis TaxID=2894196 RepID=A0A9X1SHT5_9BACT|nr:low affinity iron permease family protein [Blastopirellula sediminis]MCC9605115.1 low affinity iron permease family protein [Blastopirellula sediminis]MCC9631585.1 low affinity iron permease family protein [Blastopirellula sediminis]